MTEVISVRFGNKGKVYYFSPNNFSVAHGAFVIVETSKGPEFAECVRGNHEVDDSLVVQPLRPVIRPATAEDIARAEENKNKEKDAFEVFRRKIVEHELEMKLVDVEYNFEGSKILFFFTSEGRVDFRDLVKDLASVFKTRIELRQIGVRDEARMLGGLGICGKPFCCSQFFDDFQPVSIKMAKTQGLSLNPTKISGTCGRLMCCLKYEQDTYEELVKDVPKTDSFVETPDGKGTVVDSNLLRGKVRVKLENTNETIMKTYDASAVTVLGGKAARAEYLAERTEELAAEEARRAELKAASEARRAAAAERAARFEAQQDGGEQKRSGDSRRGKRGGNRAAPRQTEGKSGENEQKAENASNGGYKKRKPYRPRSKRGGDGNRQDENK